MKAIIRRVYKKTVTGKDGRQFDRICIDCNVIMNEKGDTLSRTAEMSVDYALKYFAHCGLTSKDLPGKVCDVTLMKRTFEDAQGQTRTFQSIKYLNMLDENGERIILNRADPKNDLGF